MGIHFSAVEKLPSTLGPDGVITVVRLTDYIALTVGETMAQSCGSCPADTSLLHAFPFLLLFTGIIFALCLPLSLCLLSLSLALFL